MALGGGTFTVQNKVLPGSYINFVSLSNGTNVFGERGTGALGLVLDYGDTAARSITKEDFQKNSMAIFGYDYTHEKLKAVRDFFKHSQTLIFANLAGGGTAASNTYAKAKYPGTRGNSLKIVIRTNVDEEEKKDVLTYMGTTLVDIQTVSKSEELVDNEYVSFTKSGDLTEDTAGTNLTNGSDGEVDGAAVQKFLTSIEKYSFNAVAIIANDDSYFKLLIEYTKRMRDEVGKKFQCVVYNCDSCDYEGTVNVPNSIDALAWTCGAIAGCAVNKSLTNTVYDGEYEIPVDYSQKELEDFIAGGKLAFHKVDDDIRVLMDINSLTEFTDEKGSVFSDNQTIRVCDQIAMDIAAIFNNYYLGKVPNDAAGRSSLWGDIVKHHSQLRDLRAIESFEDEDITVKQGESRRSVVVNDCITPINTMTQLYMKVIVE